MAGRLGHNRANRGPAGPTMPNEGNMRFSDNGYYIERYIKCDNCGVLLYEDGLKGEVAGEAKLFCSDWCQQWASARAAGVDEPRIPLPREGIHKAG